MAYTTINKSSDYFNTVQWTGNGSTNAITGVGFQPDWVWGKSHTSGYSHQLYDAVRGATEVIRTNGNNSETLSTGLTSFDSDGFTLGSNTNINASGHTVTGWNWKANGQGSANTDGSINTTYTSANTTSGMSIIQYSGNGSAGATIGHGLGVAPKCVIIKRTDTTSNWIFGTGATGFTKFLYLNTTDTETTNSGTFNNTAPSSSVITLGSWNDVNNASGTYIAYAFAEKKGFSKFGSYSGNVNVNGPFIYTGFKPAWVMIKCISLANQNWTMFDNKRDPHNEMIRQLQANTNGAEDAATDYNDIDCVSNGFKIREDNDNINATGQDYVYMAFAEAPIVGTNNIPATAR